jgi:hypothetical protein
MITAYRSDTIRNQHRDEYDNDLKAGGFADRIKCPRCPIEYSFIVPSTHVASSEFVRDKVIECVKHECPKHSETCILVPGELTKSSG